VRNVSLGRRTRRLLWGHTIVALLACGRGSFLLAQDLTTITYTTADGLPTDEVGRVVPDPRGFLWIGTSNALVRFDGETFKIYGRNEGIDVATGVNHIRLDADGHLWFATNGNGVFRFDLETTDRAARFKRLAVGQSRASNRVNAFELTRDGRLWAGTDAGLFLGRQEAGDFSRVDLPIPARQAQDSLQVMAILLRGSHVWVGTQAGVYRCSDTASRSCELVLPEAATTLLVDGEERLWIGTGDGLKVWRLENGVPTGDAREMGGGAIARIASASDGSILVAGQAGHTMAIRNGEVRVLFDPSTSTELHDVIDDAAGNIWLASRQGLVSVRRQGVSLFSTHHGLQQPDVRAVISDRHGRSYVLTDGRWLHRVDEGRLVAVRLVLPAGVRPSIWPGALLIDSSGDVWLGTADGLARYKDVSFSSDRLREFRPSVIYTRADGLAGDHIGAMLEDSRGNLWVGSVPGGSESLSVRRPHASRFETLGAADGMPPFNQPTGFFEVPPGSVWARLREGGAVRIRDGRATLIGGDHGVPWLIASTLVDRRGQLWIGGMDGVVRIADPAADEVRAIPVVSGMAARTQSLAQAVSGEILIGTDVGLFALDERSGNPYRYSSFHGLPAGGILFMTNRSDGSLLLRAARTLVHLDPSKRTRATAPPRCLISAVRVAETPIALPEAGVQRLDGVAVQSARNHIEVEFLGLSPHIGEQLSYEFRVAPLAEDWTPASQRRVDFTGLAAGRYTFEVRARGADARLISEPATVAFRVLPPWYQTWWFLGACVAIVILMAYGGHRGRLARAVYTEQLRSRVATDLHDDLGASLSQIAVSSELLRRRRADMTAEDTDRMLARIAATSRELVSSMSDIVWAVNPHQDSLADLVARMRRFAEDMFAQSDAELEFVVPVDGLELRVGPGARREILLILKESINNIVKHAQCTQAGVELGWRGRQLTMRIWDDGRGFDPDETPRGNGLRNLRTRVGRLGGQLTIVSEPGRGTEITFAIDVQ
jgi:signal transduction histidine kinase/ligand-binding sensor domain-containing protein